jgi:type II secretory pathway pseudopilin PulG
MFALAIIAIALTAALGSQSQGISLASEAKFNTTAAFLAQSKMAEIEVKSERALTSDSGEIGEDFPGYMWELNVSSVTLDGPENVSDHLEQIDLKVSWGEDEQYQYNLRLYHFVPQTE